MYIRLEGPLSILPSVNNSILLPSSIRGDKAIVREDPDPRFPIEMEYEWVDFKKQHFRKLHRRYPKVYIDDPCFIFHYCFCHTSYSRMSCPLGSISI